MLRGVPGLYHDRVEDGTVACSWRSDKFRAMLRLAFKERARDRCRTIGCADYCLEQGGYGRRIAFLYFPLIYSVKELVYLLERSSFG
jgi:hypothetical protein